MIGLIKIVKTERKNQKLRLHFVAGQQTLTTFQHEHEVVTNLCLHLNTRPEEVVRVVSRQGEQLATAQREIKRLQADLLSFEIQQLSAQAEQVGKVRLVTKFYPNGSISELRELAKRLLAQDNLVAVLAGHEGQKLNLVVSCAAGSGRSARDLLAHLLAPIEGKGSSDARLAQGGGNTTLEQVAPLFAQTRAELSSPGSN
jgi:alanyl-tRNA synthetase